LVEVGSGLYCLNAADWIAHDSYLILQDDGPPEIGHWPGSNEVALST